MTYLTSTHLGRAIDLCAARCRASSEPYLVLSDFVSQLRAGGVSESFVQAISAGVLRHITSSMVVKRPGANCYVVQ